MTETSKTTCTKTKDQRTCFDCAVLVLGEQAVESVCAVTDRETSLSDHTLLSLIVVRQVGDSLKASDGMISFSQRSFLSVI